MGSYNPKTMSTASTLRADPHKDYLDAFLRCYWFAPPVALWRAIEAKALSALAFPSPLLDFGCGDGLFTQALFGQTDGLYGCDIAPCELPSARDSGIYRHGVQFADGHHLPYRDGAFGTVYSNSVIEHIPDPQNVLPELARVLRPGGLLVLTVPSDHFRRLLDGVACAADKQAAERYARSVDALLAHYHYHTADEWRVLLAGVGVKLTYVGYYVAPEAVRAWDRMNRQFGIGRRSLFNLLVSPRLRRLGHQKVMARAVYRYLLPRLRPYYDMPARDQGGGMLVVGEKLR